MSAKSEARPHWFLTALPEITTALPFSLTVSGQDVVHHLQTVMRVRKGEHLVLADPEREQAYLCLYESGTSKSITVTVLNALPQTVSSGIRVSAAVALLKGQKWDWLLQKLTELGVQAIIPLQTQHTIVAIKDAAGKQQRWQEIVKHAAEQSEQITMPLVASPTVLVDWIDSLKHRKNLLILAAVERNGDALKPLLEHYAERPAEVVFVIGPEGGWADSERQLFEASGFNNISLGSTILRSETAAVHLAGILKHYFGF